MLQYLHRSINYFHRKNSQIFKWTHRRMYSFPNFSIRNWLCKTILKNGLSLRESRERNDIQRGKEFRTTWSMSFWRKIELILFSNPHDPIWMRTGNWKPIWLNILIWRRFSCSSNPRLEKPWSLHLPQWTPQLVKRTEEGLRLID